MIDIYIPLFYQKMGGQLYNLPIQLLRPWHKQFIKFLGGVYAVKYALCKL